MARAGRELAIAEARAIGELSVVSLIEIRNSSQNPQGGDPTSRQRTTPWRYAGVGPCSTISATAWRWLSFSLQVFPGALPLDKLSGAAGR